MRVVALLSVFVVTTGFAYVDPGVGLYLWQVLVAGVVGFGYSLLRLFPRWRRRHDADREEPPSTDAGNPPDGQ